METKICEYCKNIIEKPKYRISIKNWNNRKYCCEKCRLNDTKININQIRKKGEDNWKYKKELHFCKICGIEKSPNGKICKKCINQIFRGENHPNYKTGFSKNKRKYNYKYKQWRMSVFKRGWFTCKECGYKGKDIQAHHIKRVKENPSLIYNINNGITLCKECHNKTRCKEHLFEEKFNLLLSLT